MPLITKIVQNKKGGRYDLYLDGHFFLTVSEDVIVNDQLIKGKEISKAQIAELNNKQRFAELYQIALNKLSYSMKTVGEMRQILKKADAPSEFINQIIIKCQKQGYLNDKKFIDLYFTELLKTTNYGPRMMRQKMKQKFLSSNLIILTLDNFSENEQRKRIKKILSNSLAKKQIRGSANKFLEKQKLKLMRLGYDLDLINQVVSEMDFSVVRIAENDQLIKEGQRLWQRYKNLDPYARKNKVKLTLYRHGYQGDKINDFLASFNL